MKKYEKNSEKLKNSNKQAEYPFFAQGTAKKVILSFLFWAVGLYLDKI